MELLIRTVYPDWQFVNRMDVTDILKDALKDDSAFEYVTVTGFNYDKSTELIIFDRIDDASSSIYVFASETRFSDFIKEFKEDPHKLFVFDEDLGFYENLFEFDDFIELRDKVYSLKR